MGINKGLLARMVATGTISATVAFIAPHVADIEGWATTPYVDKYANGRRPVYTVCAGHTDRAPSGIKIDPKHKYTDDECTRMLALDLQATDGQLKKDQRYAGLSTLGQAAVLDFAYNLGASKAYKAGIVGGGNCQKYPLYNKGTVNGQLRELRGLTKRRAVEYQWCIDAK